MIEMRHLMIAAIGLPLIASILDLVTGATLSERHHLHHDTYGVPLVVLRTLVLVMFFMGILGALVGWLCHLGVFAKTEPELPLAFFVAFEFALMIMAVSVARYRVMVYDDYLVVYPPFRAPRMVRYDRIERMEWRASYLGPHLRDLCMWTTDHKRARIWCFLDIEQIMLRIDRFDVMRG